MNNPFLRLKHFKQGELDPVENHATECLAACLVFSKELRDEFIRFLFEDSIPNEIQSLEGLKILTQEPLGESGRFGRADILLSGNHFNIIVESKVNADEDERHIEQLKKYWSWLDEERRQFHKHPFSFTLIKNCDNLFRFQMYNVTQRLTWRKLHERFGKSIRPNQDDANGNLATHFCHYLEREGIVCTYKVQDMKYYSSGLKAQEAVAAVLTKVGENLEAKGYEYDLIDGNGNRWPQMKIKNPDWNKIFGEGDNYKVVFWFTVPAVVGWGADKHTFYPELYLWHDGQGNDWSRLKSKLPSWAIKLEKEHGFRFWIAKNWSKDPEPINASDMSALESKPARIYASRDKDIINMEGESVPDEAELVAKLSDQAKEFAKIISLL